MNDRGEIGLLLRSFIFFDLIFVATFCAVGFLEYANNGFVLLLIVCLLVSYYPLYAYVQEYNSTTTVRTRLWHLKYNNTALFYFVSRVVVLLGFFVIALVHLTDFDFVQGVLFFSLATKIALIVMFVCLVCLLLLVWVVTPHHRENIKNETQVARISATIIYTGASQESVLHNTYSSLDPLLLTSASHVVLIPSATSEEHTRSLTILANK